MKIKLLTMVNSKKLLMDDLNIPCKQMGLYLLGKILVRKLEDGTILKGRIVETECYLGGEDKASMTYNNRQSEANKPLYMQAGTTLVYMTYGMYFCINISSQEPGGAVLLRALEPLDNLDIMRKFRSVKRKENSKPYTDTELCNGPSKLCMAMNITKLDHNMLDICNNDMLWFEDDENDDDFKIIKTSRIGIARAGAEWATKPLRFYILSNPHVSKIDKKAEKELLES